MKKKLFVALAIAAFALIIGAGLKGCTLMPWNSQRAVAGRVSILITRDFGRKVLKSGKVLVRSGDSVMDVLHEVAKVETQYGGGFVASIDGISSSSAKPADWFYYVNGILPSRGADAFEVKPEDKIWWDYHSWNSSNFVPAVIGCYPAPFSTSCGQAKRKATIYYKPQMEILARKIGKFLQTKGAEIVYESDCKNLGGRRRQGPSFLFASAEDVSKDENLKRIFASYGSTGIFLSLDGSRIMLKDDNGQEMQTGKEIKGAIFAFSDGIGDENPLWVILSEKGEVEKVLEELLTEPSKIYGKFAVAVDSSGEVYDLPLAGGNYARK